MGMSEGFSVPGLSCPLLPRSFIPMGFQKCPVTISELLKYNRKNIGNSGSLSLCPGFHFSLVTLRQVTWFLCLMFPGQ